MSALQYYFVENGVLEHVIFNKYTIENGIIRNAKGEPITYRKIGKYNVCNVEGDFGTQRTIYVGRAIASSIIGPPPTSVHTADHIDRNPDNDTNDNIRWATKKEQQINRDVPDTLKTAFIVVNGAIEKTVKEWVEYLKDDKNTYGREYTDQMIRIYARQKQHGFSYKEYPDISGEVWKEIIGTDGKWKISDMNRVKYITKFAENVLSGIRLGIRNGYPHIMIKGKKVECHKLSFMTFFPNEYANKKQGEIILHEDDNRLDFRPHKLRIGTQSENSHDAHNNGKHDDKKSARMRCASYVNDIFEKEYESQSDAVRYLKSIGYDKISTVGHITEVLSGTRKFAYGRTWKKL